MPGGFSVSEVLLWLVIAFIIGNIVVDIYERYRRRKK